MVRKHYHNFRYFVKYVVKYFVKYFVIFVNMLKIGHVDLTVHNTVMLIKFSKQIAKGFAKITNG